MGWGYNYKCLACNITGDLYLDSGMDYPDECKRTYFSAKAGEFGQDWKSCIQTYPQGAFDCTMEVFACPVCGFWENEPRRDYYIRESSKQSLKYVVDRDDHHLTCVKQFFHTCPKCGKNMKPLLTAIESLHCLQCGELMELEPFIWD